MAGCHKNFLFLHICIFWPNLWVKCWYKFKTRFWGPGWWQSRFCVEKIKGKRLQLAALWAFLLRMRFCRGSFPLLFGDESLNHSNYIGDLPSHRGSGKLYVLIQQKACWAPAGSQNKQSKMQNKQSKLCIYIKTHRLLSLPIPSPFFFIGKKQRGSVFTKETRSLVCTNNGCLLSFAPDVV